MAMAVENFLTITRNQSIVGSRPSAVRSFETVQCSPNSTRSIVAVTSEIWQIEPAAHAIQTFETSGVRGEVFTFAKGDSAKLEFFMPSHLVILLLDGFARGCIWSNGWETRKLRSVVPNTVMFNPAQEYLRVQANIAQNHCRLMILRIPPSQISRFVDSAMDVANIRFQQQIGLDDQSVCQALVALQEEIETPGLNSVSYVDALLRLLLARLIRCASNFAKPRQPTYAKGGLPNWRLKRALELLESDVAGAPSLAELARPLRLHPTSFCRAFKQSTGVSPHRYLLTRRVNRAKEMMKDQMRSLTQIALDCGFSGSSQFSVVFKRIAGMSPREYRRSV